MKAIVWTKYGPPEGLQLRDIEKPAYKDNEILLKVYASSVTAGDCEMRGLKLPLWLALPMRVWIGFLKPNKNILGQELAGKVEAVGAGVTRFKPGDAVFGTGGLGHGGYAEYTSMPAEPGEGALAIKPANLSYEEAATVSVGGMEALHFLRKGKVQPGEKVLVNGAGGSIGSFGVQLAKYFGAEVTAVDSAGKHDMLRSIGADRVIDYTKEDFAKDGAIYDVILDVVGKNSFGRCIRSLKPNGRYLLANPSFSAMFRGPLVAMSGKKVIASPGKTTPEDLTFLGELVAAGTIRSMIDRSYPLEQTAEAHAYVERGGKHGHVVITVAQDETAPSVAAAGGTEA